MEFPGVTPRLIGTFADATRLGYWTVATQALTLAILCRKWARVSFLVLYFCTVHYSTDWTWPLKFMHAYTQTQDYPSCKPRKNPHKYCPLTPDLVHLHCVQIFSSLFYETCRHLQHLSQTSSTESAVQCFGACKKQEVPPNLLIMVRLGSPEKSLDSLPSAFDHEVETNG